jgi:hypothetical protein
VPPHNRGHHNQHDGDAAKVGKHGHHTQLLAARLIDSRPAGAPGWIVMLSALGLAGAALGVRRLPRRRRT